jgi:hypothetical protein
MDFGIEIIRDGFEVTEDGKLLNFEDCKIDLPELVIRMNAKSASDLYYVVPDYTNHRIYFKLKEETKEMIRVLFKESQF